MSFYSESMDWYRISGRSHPPIRLPPPLSALSVMQYALIKKPQIPSSAWVLVYMPFSTSEYGGNRKSVHQEHHLSKPPRWTQRRFRHAAEVWRCTKESVCYLQVWRAFVIAGEVLIQFYCPDMHQTISSKRPSSHTYHCVYVFCNVAL